MAVSFPRTNPFTGARNAIGNGVASIRNRLRSSAPVGNGPIATIQRSCKQIGPLGGILLLTQLMILIKDIFAVDALNHFFQLFSHKIKKGSAVVDPNTPKAINTESLANKELVCVVVDSIAVTLQLITALYVRIPLLPSAAQALLMMTAKYLKDLILKEEDKMIISQSDLLESNNSSGNDDSINQAEPGGNQAADKNSETQKNSQESDKAGEKGIQGDKKEQDNKADKAQKEGLQGSPDSKDSTEKANKAQQEKDNKADKTGQGGKAQGSGNGDDGSDDKTKNSNGQNPNGTGSLTNPNMGAGGMNGGISPSGMPNYGASGLITYPGGANNLSSFPGINTNGAPVYIRYDHNGSGSLTPSLGKIN